MDRDLNIMSDESSSWYCEYFIQLIISPGSDEYYIQPSPGEYIVIFFAKKEDSHDVFETKVFFISEPLSETPKIRQIKSKPASRNLDSGSTFIDLELGKIALPTGNPHYLWLKNFRQISLETHSLDEIDRFPSLKSFFQANGYL